MTIQACLQILELYSLQDHEQLHRAYRRQVKRWHPDQFAHQPAIHSQAEERLKRINHAYSTLKEHLKKERLATSRPSTTKERRTDHRRKSSPDPSTEPFHWSQWFKTKKRNKKDRQADTTRGTCANGKRSFSRKKPSFEHILREAADHPHRPSFQKRSGARPLFHPHLFRKGKKGLRIEGFRSSRPITPIRPVSKINKIGDA